MNIFLQGLTMGFAIEAPIGLANLFVINNALTQSRKRSYVAAFFVAFFDIALSVACFFGIGAIMKRFEWLKLAILLFGSLIVVYMGTNLFRAETTEIGSKDTELTMFKTISTAFVMIWFNPQAIIDGSLMLGAFQVTLPVSGYSIFISGVALASLTWFIGLNLVIAKFKDKFNARVLRIINMVCGAVIILYGLKLFYNFVILLIH
ncbi:amino acid transporter [Companilactobacillus suantsaicola]|uniref:Amino acid transporter n=1 Tax=Companilactobacillus suantsaicola TaxID=2487723 RepID=A0A4Z0JGP4_9LACO|nr:LysE family transporter [Companilactobacillus suantsaicola]TGD21957.1 amino acid transporter [Companilactobacillus suantsaicola]